MLSCSHANKAKALEESVNVCFGVFRHTQMEMNAEGWGELVKRGSACLCLLLCGEDIVGLGTHNRWITTALTFLPCVHD